MLVFLTEVTDNLKIIFEMRMRICLTGKQD